MNMMCKRKRILFINGCLDSGGVAKSIVTLLNVIDKENYDIHLLLFSSVRGPFLSYLPNGITIHRDERIEGLVDGIAGLKNLLRKKHFVLALLSVLRMLLSLFSKSASGVFLARIMPKLDLGEFDVIVDYGGQHLLYYMVDKLQGKKKISFFHDDYASWNYYYAADKKYLRKVDQVVVITEICKQSILRFFPFLDSKVSVIENIVLPSLLDNQSKAPFPERDFFLNNFVLLTVGHVSNKKGFDFAIEAVSILKQREINFQWVFIGSYKRSHVKIVGSKGLESYVHFYGVKENPYPYMKHAQIVVLPSRYEAQPIVVLEAKALCKPIVVTHFSTVPDILLEGINASVCEMNGQSLADSIETLIKHPEIRDQYHGYLERHITDNSTEINKLYDLFE